MGREGAAGADGDFNSHARVGRDRNAGVIEEPEMISTHTPAWGVTFLTSVLVKEYTISTHTPAWGVTLGLRLSEILGLFQLTRPRGA